MSKIEWTDQTWNPATGCTLISPGCANCYAKTMAKRLKAMGNRKYRNEFKLTLHDDRDTMDEPKKWQKPCMVFVCSMSDLFHEDVPDWFIEKVLAVCAETPRHTYQILTKRAKRMADFFEGRDIPRNVWLGVTVEDNKYGRPRIHHLQRIMEAEVRFLSCEPLLENLDDLGNMRLINWVICGGESGALARPMAAEWALSLRDQCLDNRVPFFFKQWGKYGENGQKGSKKANGRLLNGFTYDQMPGHYAPITIHRKQDPNLL